MGKVLAIVHQATSDPGRVGQVLREYRCFLDIRCPAIGDELPETLDHHAAVVIFGGPMSANEEATLPHIRAELDWIPVALASGKPYLGICLGAQMLAKVLGAKVAPHAEDWREIGYSPIVPTLAGQMLFPAAMQVYQWHREGFELPRDAVLLAEGDRFPNQAFRYGETAYGIQFHPEITPMMIDRWTSRGADQLTLPGAQSRVEQMQNHARYGAAVESWLRRFLKHWLMVGQVPLGQLTA